MIVKSKAITQLPGYTPLVRSSKLADGIADSLLNRYRCAFGDELDGFLAFEQSLIIFGFSNERNPLLDVQWHNAFSPFKDVYGLTFDHHLIVGCDVLGDLLVLSGDDFCRLDGETGTLEFLASSVDDLFSQPASQLADLFGLRLAKRVLPRWEENRVLRVLPTRPYLVAGGAPTSFFATPLLRAMGMKLRLFQMTTGAPDGTSIEFDFWN